MNRPVHFEIHAPDPATVIPFYESVFGWQFARWGGPFEYWLATTGEGDGINGGLMRSRDGQPRTVNTLQVKDVDAACQQVQASGGKVVVEKFPISGMGYVAYCTDPGGNIFGVTHADPTAA